MKMETQVIMTYHIRNKCLNVYFGKYKGKIFSLS